MVRERKERSADVGRKQSHALSKVERLKRWGKIVPPGLRQSYARLKSVALSLMCKICTNGKRHRALSHVQAWSNKTTDAKPSLE